MFHFLTITHGRSKTSLSLIECPAVGHSPIHVHLSMDASGAPVVGHGGTTMGCATEYARLAPALSALGQHEALRQASLIAFLDDLCVLLKDETALLRSQAGPQARAWLTAIPQTMFLALRLPLWPTRMRRSSGRICATMPPRMHARRSARSQGDAGIRRRPTMARATTCHHGAQCLLR